MPTADQLKAAAIARIAAIDVSFGRMKTKLRHAQYGAMVMPEEFAEFNSRCFAVIDQVTSKDDSYYVQALHELDVHETLSSEGLAFSLYGLVQSLKSDIQAGTVASWRESTHTDLLAGFITHVEGLLGQGCKDAAAVVLGSVLETHLRLLVARYDVVMADTDGAKKREPADRSISAQLSNALAQSVFTNGEHREVVAWLDLTRHATRGASGRFTQAAVEAFLAGLRGLLAEYPA